MTINVAHLVHHKRHTIRAARYAILDAANKARRHDLVPPLYMRHLQRAVCIVRRNKLVKAKVLQTAGFNAA